jgi:cytochrome c peroxidase
MRRLLSLVAVLAAGACGDAATGTESDEFAAVRDALTINPQAPPNYSAQALPAFYRPGMVLREDRTPLANPTTDAGALLGRVLFYDVNLSRTRNVSCASCHAQNLAFGD